MYKLINYDMLDAMVIVPFSMHDHAVIDQVVQECIKHDVPLISIDMEIPGAFTVQFGYGEAFGTIVEHVRPRVQADKAGFRSCGQSVFAAACRALPGDNAAARSDSE